MASVSKIRPLIIKWEGGLSKNPNDSASAFPAPWPYNGVVNGYHTNKGVTYKTFVGLAPKLNYAVTPENFFTMPDAIWDKIFKQGYWDPWNLDLMNSQAIANLIGDMSWGSGVGGSFNSIQKYLVSKGISVSTKAEAVNQINKLTFSQGEKKIFEELIQWRANFFKSLSSFPTFGKGWLNRLADIEKLGLETIQKKKLP